MIDFKAYPDTAGISWLFKVALILQTKKIQNRAEKRYSYHPEEGECRDERG